MAEISVTVTTPKVPTFIEVKMPGATKATRLALSEFSEEDLDKIAAEWRIGLRNTRRAQLAETSAQGTGTESVAPEGTRSGSSSGAKKTAGASSKK